jgi:hypothetical protein
MQTNPNSSGTQFIDRGDRFTVLPTALVRGQLAPALSVDACWLYTYLKSIHGQSPTTTLMMSQECRMSVGTVSKAKRELVDAGLITITRRDEQSDLIEINSSL